MIEFVQVCIGGLLVGAIYSLIALGFSLIYRVTGAVNLAQGGFALVGALVGYSFSETMGLPLPIALVLAVAATTALGAAIGGATFVPALRRLSNANLLMLTVGLLTMLEGAALIVWGSQPYSLRPFTGEQPFEIGQLRVPSQAVWVSGTTIVVVAALWYVVNRTRLGRSLRACAENQHAAALMGINVPRTATFSFAFATFIAAIAGIVVAPTTTLQFNSGALFTISGFIAVVIGGISSFPGAIVGGLLLGLTTQLATAYVSSLFSSAIALFILLLVLIYAPTGIVRSKIVRRQDIREDARVWGHITRLRPSAALCAAIVAIAVALVLPWIVGDTMVSNLTMAAIIFIALIGLDLLMGYTGQVSLGQAGFMAIGGYTAGYLVINFGIEPLLGILAGVVLSLACALVLSIVTLRLRGLYLALATLAFGLLIESFAVGLIDVTGGPSGMVGIPSFSIGPIDFGSPIRMYYLVVALVIAILTMLFGALRSSFGRALQAIRTDQVAASAIGVNVVRYKLVVFAISAALASLSGSLLAFSFNFLAPDMIGSSRSFELVSMLVIGGEGTLIGPVFGSILITLLPTIFQPLSLYKTFFNGALLILCFLYLPRGLFGVVADALNALGRQWDELRAPRATIGRNIAHDQR